MKTKTKYWKDYKINAAKFFKDIDAVEKESKEGFDYDRNFFNECFDLHMESLGYAYDLIVNSEEKINSQMYL
ncbi:MAG: hypothetical protein A3C35_05765 [Omnitrophica bacterium RIFCSPHIGHO2_02_FULL_46_11]|nr:MAG: hypothetical protein A3C35_05765 [Omnitrophica bacterium RIFCSPHIGHO2_02_FULL_46_11]OGW86457.1 MAG: hypothetical protein A3A81_02705 [Omnitrophica bacterium RIFCSPLOWO2_01_FULL_45_10b]